MKHERAAGRAGVLAYARGSAVAMVLAIAASTLSGCAEGLFYAPARELTPTPLDISPDARKLQFKSTDSTELCGWFIPNTLVPARDAATVVHVHGNAGSMLGHRFFVDWLPAKGFNVLMFDYRGYGESKGSAWWREDLVADACAALAVARALPEIDPTRIALFGQSLGGAIAAVMAGQDASGSQPPIRAVVLESPFAGWRDMAACWAGGGDPPNAFGTVLASLLIRDQVNGVPEPQQSIASVEAPVLVLHGTADRTIPVTHGQRVAAAATHGTFTAYEGADHNTLQVTHPQARAQILEFLRANTGPVTP